MRKSFGPSNKITVSPVETVTSPYEIIVNIEKYELENVIETSAAFITISFKVGNRKLDGIEKANIIKKMAKYKNENFKLETNFLELSQSQTFGSPQVAYKEKKAEFIISLSVSSSKSSKVETLSTITIPLNLSAYLNDQILEKDDSLLIKNSKYAGSLNFHIAFHAKFSSKFESRSMRNSPMLRKTKSFVNLETEESKNDKNVKSLIDLPKKKPLETKKSPVIKRKQTAPGHILAPKIVVKGPALDSNMQKIMGKSPDELEKKWNSLLGSGLQTMEETEFLNRKLEILALKEENSELKEEVELLKEEKNSLLKAFAEINEEKRNWHKCFKINQETNRGEEVRNYEVEFINAHKVSLDLLEKVKKFEEKFLNEEENLKDEIRKIKEENKMILNENKGLLEKSLEEENEIFRLKNELSIKQEKINESAREKDEMNENYVRLKEDLGNIINIILTKGNGEIMDLIEPFLHS